MNLQCSVALGSGYTSASQIARVLTEDWCARELYCPACKCDFLTRAAPNKPVLGFMCATCTQPFQLKSLRNWNPRKIVDAGYEAMLRAIRLDNTPNLLLLQYSSAWWVENLLLIPRMFLSPSVIERRNPLGPNAKRAGWVGCNILLDQIPADGKISIVSSGVPVRKSEVRKEFSRVRELCQLPPSLRGWTVDVLGAVRRLGKRDFSLHELYASEPELKALHPLNSNVRAKIRQQLQILRDIGLISFVSAGRYRLG